MKLTIKNIILYPKNKTLKPRFLTFEERKINIITGYSQRGKSAIISIIDYCLGSTDCNIPIGLIRDKVDKFAIYISIDNENIFIARDPNNPSIMYFHSIKEKGECPSFNYNSWITQANQYRVDVNYVKKYFGYKAGFENLSQKHDSFINGFDFPSSFRDTAAFLFQSQSIIANPSTIFFKTDSFKHLKRLMLLFPLALGYKSFDIIKLEKDIEIIEREKSAVKNKFDDIKKQYENWQTDVYRYYSESVKLGLSNSDIDIQKSTMSQLIKELNEVVTTKKVKQGASLISCKKIAEFEKIREEKLRILNQFKVDLAKIERFEASKNNYISDTVSEIDIRLKPIDWFLKQKGTNVCPFCDSISDKAINELLSLKDFQEENKRIIDDSTTLGYSFENDKYKLRQDINDVEVFLEKLESNISILQNEDKEYYQRSQDIYEFIGKVKHVLDRLLLISPSGTLDKEISVLNDKLRPKVKALSDLMIKYSKTDILNNLSDTIGDYVKLLPIEERVNRKVIIDPDKSANIQIKDVISGNISFLSRIGSGANHMCYHLATMLGLHEYFLSLSKNEKNNFIPSFLVLDQPSQVYFPESFPNENEKIKKDSAKYQDLEDTKKIFQTCSKFMEKTNFQTQIIILEHAPLSTWKNVKHINLVEEWRGKENDLSNYKALIPSEWLNN